MYILKIKFNPPKWLVGVTALHSTAEIQPRLVGVDIKPCLLSYIKFFFP